MADGFHTHLPFLVTALCNTYGSVLEIGGGFYSTPILSDLCGKMGRLLHTCEHPGPYADALKDIGVRPHHTFTIVSDYSQVPYDKEWGLALIDHGSGAQRVEALRRLKPWAKVIVVHGADGPDLIREVQSFASHVWCKHLKPWKTAIVSDTVPLSEWDITTPATDMVVGNDPSPPAVSGGPLDATHPLVKDGYRDQNDARESRRPPPTSKKQSNLLLYNKQGHSFCMEDHWKGATAFLVLSGPSSNELDLSKIQRRGVVTMAVNNAWSLVRPTIWTSVDDPCTFLDAGWKDPGILKLVPYGLINKRLGTKHGGKWRWSGKTVGEMPNLLFYKRNEHFKVNEYLHEDTVNWGNHKKVVDSLGCGGSRSVMLAAMRLLFYLGFRTVNLVGCDFKMSEEKKYAFPQERCAGAIRGNNNTYRDLNIRFKALRPLMEAQGMKVFNCNPNSGLEAFDHKPYDACVAEADRFNDPAALDTFGWYDTVKAGGKKLPEGVNPP